MGDIFGGRVSQMYRVISPVQLGACIEPRKHMHIKFSSTSNAPHVTRGRWMTNQGKGKEQKVCRMCSYLYKGRLSQHSVLKFRIFNMFNKINKKHPISPTDNQLEHPTF